MKINPIISRPIASKSLSSRPFVRKVALGAMAVGAAMSINACSYISNPVKKQCTDVYEYMDSYYGSLDQIKEMCEQFGTYYTSMAKQREADFQALRLAIIYGDNRKYDFFDLATERAFAADRQKFIEIAEKELKNLKEDDVLIFRNKKHKYPTADECIFHLDLIAQTHDRIDYDEYERKSIIFDMKQGKPNSIKKAHLIAYKQHLILAAILIDIAKDCNIVFSDKTTRDYYVHEILPKPNEGLKIVK